MIEYLEGIIDEENKSMNRVNNIYELKFDYRGIKAKVVRQTKYGYLCGYILVSSDSTGEMMDDLDIIAHGGITYDREGWLGFDCAHYGDLNIEMLRLLKDSEISTEYETYKDLSYVIGNLKKMIDKIKEYEERLGMEELVKLVEQWSKNKGLDTGNPDRQALKFYEETGEVAAALSRGNLEGLKDGIGDTIVTLIILAQQHDMTLEECLQCAYDEIKGRTGKMINGTFVKSEDLK